MFQNIVRHFKIEILLRLRFYDGSTLLYGHNLHTSYAWDLVSIVNIVTMTTTNFFSYHGNDSSSSEDSAVHCVHFIT